ncbi:MAG: hypothetical protein WC614_01810 [bacterium]
MKMIRKYIILFLLLVVASGCDTPSVSYKTGKISLLFINELNEEVLIKNKNGDVGFIGVFVLSKQQYLWQWQDSIEIRGGPVEPGYTFNFQTIFSFFTAGDSNNFDKYVGEDTFNVGINKEGYEYADTCYIK